MMSIAILLVGFIVFATTGFPGFYPLAMLGGASWCIGGSEIILFIGIILFHFEIISKFFIPTEKII